MLFLFSPAGRENLRSGATITDSVKLRAAGSGSVGDRQKNSPAKRRKNWVERCFSVLKYSSKSRTIKWETNGKLDSHFEKNGGVDGILWLNRNIGGGGCGGSGEQSAETGTLEAAAG